jgi:RNA recognition motif-containing protein
MGKRLYVGNLPYDADEATLRTAFSKDGRTVERVHIVLDRETQRPRGFAFVEMATDEQAKAAITAMDGAVFGTRQLRVTEAEERRPGGGPGGPGGLRGPGGPGAGPRPMGGGGGGGGGPVGAPRSDDASRPRNFGPDARPKREREREMGQRRAAQPKRRTDGNDDPFGGRRGNSRFDDDEE